MTITLSSPALPRLQDLSTKALQDRVANTQYAFRVFDDQAHTTYDQEQGFRNSVVPSGSMNEDVRCAYRAAAHHVDRSFQVRTAWISASLRWDWALWEMARRRQDPANRNIRVAIIDTYTLPSESTGPDEPNLRPYHALQLLDPPFLQKQGWKSTWSGRQPAQLQNFANVADEILFVKNIPASAVVSVVGLDDIIRDVPGYGTGWLEGASFRDAHTAMYENHLTRSSWDHGIKALEYVNFAFALLRPAYNNLRSVTWSLFLDVVRDSSPLLVAETRPGNSRKLKGHGKTPDPMESLVGAISVLSVQTPSSQNGRDRLKQSEADASAFQTRMKFLSDQTTRALAALKAEVSKQSMILDLTRLLAKEAYTSETRQAGHLEPLSPAGSGDYRPRIHAMVVRLSDQCRVVVSPEIARQRDSVRDTIQGFKQQSRKLAISLLCSYIARLPDVDWARLEPRITNAVNAKVTWLEDALGFLGGPEEV